MVSMTLCPAWLHHVQLAGTAGCTPAQLHPEQSAVLAWSLQAAGATVRVGRLLGDQLLGVQLSVMGTGVLAPNGRACSRS